MNHIEKIASNFLLGHSWLLPNSRLAKGYVLVVFIQVNIVIKRNSANMLSKKPKLIDIDCFDSKLTGKWQFYDHFQLFFCQVYQHLSQN
jgi:hypothetical protein